MVVQRLGAHTTLTDGTKFNSQHQEAQNHLEVQEHLIPLASLVTCMHDHTDGHRRVQEREESLHDPSL